MLLIAPQSASDTVDYMDVKRRPQENFFFFFFEIEHDPFYYGTCSTIKYTDAQVCMLVSVIVR